MVREAFQKAALTVVFASFFVCALFLGYFFFQVSAVTSVKNTYSLLEQKTQV